MLRHLLPFLLIAGPLAADHGHAKPAINPYDLRGLTKDPSPNEPLALLDPEMANRSTRLTRALPVSPRMVAEWEPVQAALIRYPLGIAVEAVKTIASELKVYVLCSSAEQANARSAFQSGGVNMANISFITATTDTYWTRDYAPWWVETTEAGKRVIRPVDVVYRVNGERPNDDRVPGAVSDFLKIPTTFALNFVCQGGNVMCDAANGGASTDRLRDENPGMTDTQLQQLAKDVVGLNPYYVMTDPAYPADYIKHIDCWAKFINSTTVLVKRVPSTDSYYNNYEAAAGDWAKRTNAAGQPYKVIRIDGSGAAPYVNHVILNDRVLVPILKDTTDPADSKALSQIQAAYGSKFRIVGVKAAPGLPWLGTDSIHCRVNSVPVLASSDPTTSAPSITSQPTSKSVSVGQTATFSVTATGTAPLSYQWYKNNAAISGATASSYTTPATVAGDNGATFYVKVSNSVGSVNSSSATLSVGSAPPPSTTNLAQGKAATVSSTYSTYAASNAVDGSTSTSWVATTTTPSQWIYVNLGSAQTVGRAVAQWSNTNYPKSVSIQYYNGTAWTTISANQAATAGTQTYTFTPTSAQYWRVLANTPNSGYYQLFEYQLFAK